MSEKVDVPVQLSEKLEAAIQKVAEHTGYTRDEVIEKIMVMTLDLAEDPSDRIEMPSFMMTIKRALKKDSPQF